MSNIDKDDIYNVVIALIGETNPVGETHIDNLRYENLAKLTALTEMLLGDIATIAEDYKNNHQYSMKRASKFCSDFYDYIGIADNSEEVG